MSNFPKPFVCGVQTGDDGYPRENGRGTEISWAWWQIGAKQQFPRNHLMGRSVFLNFAADINVEYLISTKSRLLNISVNIFTKGFIAQLPSLLISTTIVEIQLVGTTRLRYSSSAGISTLEVILENRPFHFHYRNLSSVRFGVHLENGQRVYFLPDNARWIASNPISTTLTAFLTLCRVDSFAAGLLHTEVPSYIVDSKIWQKSVYGLTVESWDGSVPKLLMSSAICMRSARNTANDFIQGCSLWDKRGLNRLSIQNDKGILHRIFFDVCAARNSVSKDQQWQLAIALSTRMPFRNLFALIICQCSPANPSPSWMRFRCALSEDIHRSFCDLNNIPNAQMHLGLAYGAMPLQYPWPDHSETANRCHSVSWFGLRILQNNQDNFIPAPWARWQFQLQWSLWRCR